MKLSREEALDQGRRFLDFLGVKTIEEARALPAEYIRDKNDAFGAFWGTIPDGVYQTDTYWNNMVAGKFLDVPMMTGFTNNEFLTMPQAETMEALKKKRRKSLGTGRKSFFPLLRRRTA